MRQPDSKDVGDRLPLIIGQAVQGSRVTALPFLRGVIVARTDELNRRQITSSAHSSDW